MNDPMIIASAAVIVIGALTTSVVTVMSSFAKMKREIMAKVDSVEGKADQIHNLVNGSASAAAAKLAGLEDRIVQLHERIEQLQEQRVADATVVIPVNKLVT